MAITWFSSFWWAALLMAPFKYNLLNGNLQEKGRWFCILRKTTQNAFLGVYCQLTVCFGEAVHMIRTFSTGHLFFFGFCSKKWVFHVALIVRQLKTSSSHSWGKSICSRLCKGHFPFLYLISWWFLTKFEPGVDAKKSQFLWKKQLCRWGKA